MDYDSGGVHPIPIWHSELSHTRENEVKLRLPPPAWALLSLLAMTALDMAEPSLTFLDTLGTLAGVALAIPGILMVLWAAFRFKSVGTTINPMTPEKTTTLVIKGPYRFTRNPMYLGLLLIQLGWGLKLGNALPFVFPALFAVLLTHLQIKHEEQALRDLFGSAYIKYCQRVGRWFWRI